MLKFSNDNEFAALSVSNLPSISKGLQMIFDLYSLFFVIFRLEGIAQQVLAQ